MSPIGSKRTSAPCALAGLGCRRRRLGFFSSRRVGPFLCWVQHHISLGSDSSSHGLPLKSRVGLFNRIELASDTRGAPSSFPWTSGQQIDTVAASSDSLSGQRNFTVAASIANDLAADWLLSLLARLGSRSPGPLHHWISPVTGSPRDHHRPPELYRSRHRHSRTRLPFATRRQSFNREARRVLGHLRLPPLNEPSSTPFRFVSFRFVSFRFVSFRFVSFRFVSFRFVSFRLVLFASNLSGEPSLRHLFRHILRTSL
jgi:hypothetical protein